MSNGLLANSASGVVFSSAIRLAKAASVGANTVNGPGPDKVSVRPAATTALTKMLNSGASAMAVCTMFLSAGKITLLMTCTTPFLALMSVAMICDSRLRPSVMMTLPPTASILKMSWPSNTGSMGLPNGIPALSTTLPSTWYCSTPRTKALLAGTSRSLAVLPAPSSSTAKASKAALSGANTV